MRDKWCEGGGGQRGFLKFKNRVSADSKKLILLGSVPILLFSPSRLIKVLLISVSWYWIMKCRFIKKEKMGKGCGGWS